MIGYPSAGAVVEVRDWPGGGICGCLGTAAGRLGRGSAGCRDRGFAFRSRVGSLPDERLLGEGGHVSALVVEDASDGESAHAGQAVGVDVDEQPAVRPDGSEEPDGVIEAGTHEHLVVPLTAATLRVE